MSAAIVTPFPDDNDDEKKKAPKKKPSPDDFKTVKRPTAIRTIKLGEISVSPAAQREFREYKGRAILNAFDEGKIGIFTVSHRDGRYWLIDGQHRRWALAEYIGDGWEEWDIEVLCHFGLTEAAEAELFLVLNDHLAVSALDTFKVAVTAERTIESDINRVVLALLSRFLRRQLPLILIALVLAAAVVWSWIVWPLTVWAPVWALTLVAALVVVSLRAVDECDRLHRSPDCGEGKHRACRGDAWCTDLDVPALCDCDCHEAGAAVAALVERSTR
jgi:hypothetical protein